jgi:hypothetical protein
MDLLTDWLVSIRSCAPGGKSAASFLTRAALLMDLDHLDDPFFGLAAYLYLEVRPTLRKFNTQSLLWNFKSQSERIRILQGSSNTTTIKNRLALADELRRAGKYDQECQVIEQGSAALCRRRPASDALSEANLEGGRAQEAEQMFSKSSRSAPPILSCGTSC